MIIVRIQGGIGNQMFQYALAQSLRMNGSEVKIDISPYQYDFTHNGYELQKVFHIDFPCASEKEVDRYADMKRDILNKIRRKIFGKQNKCEFNTEEDATGFRSEVFKADTVYFNGYWQNENYFKHIEYQIREDFRFAAPLNQKSKEMSSEIQHHDSVSIHVRRGDYLKYVDQLGTVGLGYYHQAINEISNCIKNPKYFVFSDDIEWCKKNLRVENIVYIDFNKAHDNYMDMQLMSLCKHNIIANSSFSWWGAWLNANPDKLVIAPAKWFVNENDSNNLPESWIRIKNDRKEY